MVNKGKKKTNNLNQDSSKTSKFDDTIILADISDCPIIRDSTMTTGNADGYRD
jgi:hypothetical protein